MFRLDGHANARLRLLYVAMGMLDGLITSHSVLKSVLAERGIAYSLVETPGYAHEWRYWRFCLADIARRLFRARPE